MSDVVEVTCPCCGTELKVDAETGAVLLEKRPKRSKSFEEALAVEKQKEQQADSLFKKAVATVGSEKEILEKKLREAIKKAEEEKDKPLPPRPFDLD
jgi:uncharacterized Zn finger protein (UPF0148 family)